MTLKECIPASSTLLYHRAIARRAASFMVFLEKIIRREWHKPYAFLMSGYSSNRIAALCFCFSVHLSADLKSRYRERISNSLRVSPLEYHNIEIDGNTETFTCAQVRPPTTPDLEIDLMVPYGH